MGENLQPSGTSSVFEGEDGTLFFDAFEFDFLEDEDGDGIPFFDTVQFVEDLVEYDDDIEEVIDTEIINLDPPHIVPRWKRVFGCLVQCFAFSCTRRRRFNEAHALEESDEESADQQEGRKTTSTPLRNVINSPLGRFKRLRDGGPKIQSSGEEATAPARRTTRSTRATSLDTTKQDASAKPDDANDNNNNHPDTASSSLFQDDVLSRRRTTSYGLERQPDPSESDNEEESDSEDDEYYYKRPFASPSNIELTPRPLSRKTKRSPFYKYIENPNKNIPKEQNYNWHVNNNDAEEEKGEVIDELDAVGEEHNVKRAGVAYMGDKSQVRMLFVYHFPPIDALLMQYGLLYCLCAGALPMNFTVHITLNMLILVSMMLYGLRFTNAMPIIMESVAWANIIPYFFPHDVCDKKKRNSKEYKVYQAVEKDLDTLAARYISYLTYFFPNLQVVVFVGAAWDYYVLHRGMVDPAMVPQDEERIRLAHLSSFRFGALYSHVVAWGRVLSAAFAMAFGVKDPLPTMEREELELFLSMLVQNRRNEESWKSSIKEGMANMTDEAKASWKLSIKEGMANMTAETKSKRKSNLQLRRVQSREILHWWRSCHWPCCMY